MNIALLIIAYLGIALGVHYLWLSKAQNTPKWEQIALSLIWILLIPLWLIRKIQTSW